MNKKSSKLLAAVAVFAMVACVFVAVAPVEEADAAVADTDVAKIGEDEGYATLDAAIEAAVSGDTITLLKNVTVGNIDIPAGVTLAMDGKKITITGTVNAHGILSTTDDTPLSEVSITSTGSINVYKTATVLGYNASEIFSEYTGTGVVMTITDSNGTVAGFDMTVKANATYASLTVAADHSLTIASGITVTASTGITNGGTIYNAGTIAGTINNTGTYFKVIDSETGYGTTQANLTALTGVTNSGAGAFGEWVSDDNYWKFQTINTVDTLTLHGYNGSQTFNKESNYTVVLEGKNVIDRSSIDDSSVADSTSIRVVLGEASLSNETNLTIMGSGSLTVKTEKYKNVIGIGSATITIGKQTLGAGETKAVINVESYNKAIYSQGLLTVQNATVTATAFEKAVRSQGELKIESTASVVANLTSVGEVNGTILDDITGTKVGKLTLNGELTTDGILIDGTGSQIKGKLTVRNNSLNIGVNNNSVQFPGGFIVVAESDYTIQDVTIFKAADITVETECNVVAKFFYSNDSDVAQNANYVILGDVTEGDASKKLVYGVVAASEIKMKHGSYDIDGAYTIEGTGSTARIVINGAVKISGTVDVPIRVNSNSVITVPAGRTLTLVEDMEVVNPSGGTASGVIINILGDIDGTGKITSETQFAATSTNVVITATNPIVAQKMVDISKIAKEVTVSAVAAQFNPTDKTAAESLIASNNILVLSNDLTLTYDLTIPAGVTLYLNGNTLKVGNANYKDVTLTVDGGKIVTGYHAITAGAVTENKSTVAKIEVNANLILDAADVCAPVSINEQTGYVSISNPIVSEIVKNIPDTINVGYGNTVILTDATVPAGMKAYVYGTLELNGTVTTAYGSVVEVAESGKIEVNGTLDILGTVVNGGSIIVDGTANVANTDGGSLVETSGYVEVNGTFNVTKPKAGNTAKVNALTITGSNIENGKGFVVYGTMNVTGNVTGQIEDNGTVTFNGTVPSGQEASIVLYDGITLTVQSVTGTLKVTDAGIFAEDVDGLTYYATSCGNEVTLTGVKGVTVSVETTSKTVEMYGQKYRFEVADMIVTGIASAAAKDGNGSISVKGGSESSYSDSSTPDTTTKWSDKVVKGGVTVTDMTLGKKIELTFADGKMAAAGAINAVAEDSAVWTTGTVTVTGLIIIGPDANYNNASTPVQALPTNYNGARYDITDATDGEITVYITTFVDALAAIMDADDDSITVSGTVKVDSDMTIPAGAEVIFDSSAVVTIEENLTVEATALLNATAAVVKVEGTLVVNDKNTGITHSTDEAKFVYQVYTENGDVATYSGLIGAMENAKEGDVITLRQNAMIDEDLTIPAGVTLVIPSGKTLTIDNSEDGVKLTVDGTLDVQKKGMIAASAASTDNKKAEIVINGVYMDALGDDASPAPVMSNYVTYADKVDGVNYDFYTNLTYAAANCTSGDITVVGTVSAGEIALVEGDKDALRLVVSKNAVVNATSVTLDDAEIVIQTKTAQDDANTLNGVVNADVIVNATAGKAVLTLSKVSGLTIAAVTETEADGEVISMTVVGDLVGAMTVSEGTVEIGSADLTVGKTDKDVMTVASGATAVIGKNAVLTVASMTVPTGIEKCAGLVVEGTVEIVEGTLTVTGIADVDGAITADETGIITITASTGVMNLLGTVTIDEKNTNVVINGIVNAGEPIGTIGATAAIVGPVDIGTTGKVVVFTDADMAGAKFDWNSVLNESDAETTTYNVNGDAYMTVYVDANTSVTNGAMAPFEVKGLQKISKWYANADYKSGDNDVNGIDVGVYENVYANAEPSVVTGSISEGSGITLYIDGKTVDNFYTYVTVQGIGVSTYYLSVGEHTVSYDVKTGYDGKNVVVTFNGATVANGGKIVVDADMDEFTIVSTGAVPAETVIVDKGSNGGMSLTEILLIVLVVLIAIMAIVIAMRMMRS